MPKVDAALHRWFTEVNASDFRGIADQDLQRKAQEFSNALGYDMNINLSWITRWRRRHDVVSRIAAGESASVDLDKVNTWRRDVLAQIRANYKPEDTFNADETAIFWKALPNKTLTFKGRKCKGGKQCKERITALCAASMTGKSIYNLISFDRRKVATSCHRA